MGAMEDTGDANVVTLTLVQLQSLNPCLGMVEDMVDTGDESVERLKLMLNLNLRPRHTTISTILITMFILPIIMLGNDLLMPNLCHGGMADITEDTGDKKKEDTEFSIK